MRFEKPLSRFRKDDARMTKKMPWELALTALLVLMTAGLFGEERFGIEQRPDWKNTKLACDLT